MAIPLTINGVTFQYPQQFDLNWGPTLTNWSTAVTNALVPITGGILTAANNTTAVRWRNFLDSAYLNLAVNTSNQLTFNGVPIGATTSLTNGHIFVGNGSNQPTDVVMSGDTTIINTGAVTIANSAITNAKVSSSAAIDYSKLATLTASKALASDSSGVITTSSTTDTELGYVHGVTSAIQTQLDTFSITPVGCIQMYAGASAPSGWLLCDGSVVAQATYAALYTVCSTTFNTGGEGAGNFRLPSLTNNAPIGAGSIAALGVTAGAQTHSVTTSEMPTHNHTVVVSDPGHTHTVTDPGHVHNQTTSGGTGATSNGVVGAGNHNPAIDQSANQNTFSHSTGVSNNTNTTGITASTNNTGSGTAMSLVQPSLGLTFIIKY